MTRGIDPRAVQAAQNNADWYEAMFSVHGLPYERLHHGVLVKADPPPYYSNLTIAQPNHFDAVKRTWGSIAARSHGSIVMKDSFCEVEPAKHGFKELFRAQWIWRPACRAVLPSGWGTIQSSDDLELWEACWKEAGSPCDERVFPAAILDRKDVQVFGQWDKGRIIAGCIANLSVDVIGLSNVFALNPSSSGFAHAADAVASLDETRPVVGYESGDALDWASACGFDQVGELRILIQDAVAQ